MNKNQFAKEKVCAFYASDYHFEMMSLPYINKEIENDKNILILSQNNLEKTLKIVLSKMNLDEDRKEKILNIDWNSSSFEKIENVKNGYNNDELTIFIKGEEKYIKKTNEKIEEELSGINNFKVINCYSLEEVGENLNNIMNDYKKVLNTGGIKNI